MTRETKLSCQRRLTSMSKPAHLLRWIPAFAGMTILIGSVIAHAETTPQQRLDATQRQLSAAREHSSQLNQQATALDLELKGLRDKLIAATSAADSTTKDLDEIESNLDDLEGTAARRSVQLAAQRQQLSETLALLQRLALTPPAAQLLSPTSPLDRLRTDLQLKAILPEIEERRADLAATVADMRLLQQRLEEKRQRALATQRRLASQQQDLNGLMDERTRRLASTRAQNAQEEARATQLAGQAQNLRDLVDRMEADQRQRESDQANLPETASALRLTALPSGAARRLPVSAPSLVRFGQKDAFGTTSKGITLRPRPGSAAAAVAAGRIAFAGPFRGYGRVLILEHAGGFHTVLAGLDKVTVAVGQRVAAGEPLGTISSEPNPPPELYFEVRHDGVPVDPLGSVAAQLTRSRSP